MTPAALIPARGGSTRVKGKNLRLIEGKSLLAWTILDAQAAGLKVYVTSDDGAILATAESYGAHPIRRPSDLAQYDTPIEPVVEHALGEMPPVDTVIMLNCTAPIRQRRTIKEALQLFKDSPCCVFSAVDARGLLWFSVGPGGWQPAYDPQDRPPSQKWARCVRENGSFWIFDADHIATEGAIVCEKATPYYMHPLDSFEIDTEGDLAIVEQLFKVRR